MRVGTLLAAILVTLCLGVQLLEATGQWDRTIQDAGDEAAIVSVVLCVGAALMVAARNVLRLCRFSIATRFLLVRSILPFVVVAPYRALPPAASPPLPLRV